MFVSFESDEHVFWFEPGDLLVPRFAEMHIDGSIKDDEDFHAVVSMPPVGFIGPVQPDGSSVDLRKIEGTPSSISSKRFYITYDPRHEAPPKRGFLTRESVPMGRERLWWTLRYDSVFGAKDREAMALGQGTARCIEVRGISDLNKLIGKGIEHV
ncbi:MAG: hypothetical protein MI920_28205 [Kiloniellales bacterium]|nr:hypothetical protein [Kiloniellales bacterium]